MSGPPTSSPPPPQFGVKHVGENEHICSQCDKAGVGYQRCAACRRDMYCSRDCQRAHYPVHKPLCLLVQKKHGEDEALAIQCQTMGQRWGSFSACAPLVSMLVFALSKRCGQPTPLPTGVLMDDTARSPARNNPAYYLLPVVGLSLTGDKVYVRLSPRCYYEKHVIDGFVRATAGGKAYNCLVEPFPFTAMVNHCQVTMDFEIAIPAGAEDTPAGKATLEGLALSERLADVLLSTAASRADAMVFHATIAQGQGIRLESPVVVQRPQLEELFVTKKQKQQQATLAAAGAAEIQPRVLTQLGLGPAGGAAAAAAAGTNGVV